MIKLTDKSHKKSLSSLWRGTSNDIAVKKHILPALDDNASKLKRDTNVSNRLEQLTEHNNQLSKHKDAMCEQSFDGHKSCCRENVHAPFCNGKKCAEADTQSFECMSILN